MAFAASNTCQRQAIPQVVTMKIAYASRRSRPLLERIRWNVLTTSICQRRKAMIPALTASWTPRRSGLRRPRSAASLRAAGRVAAVWGASGEPLMESLLGAASAAMSGGCRRAGRATRAPGGDTLEAEGGPRWPRADTVSWGHPCRTRERGVHAAQRFDCVRDVGLRVRGRKWEGEHLAAR